MTWNPTSKAGVTPRKPALLDRKNSIGGSSEEFQRLRFEKKESITNNLGRLDSEYHINENDSPLITHMKS